MMSCLYNFVHVSIIENNKTMNSRYDSCKSYLLFIPNELGFKFTNHNKEWIIITNLYLHPSCKLFWQIIDIFHNFIWCVWEIMRVWDHHLTEICIHKDWPRTANGAGLDQEKICCDFIKVT